MRRRGSGRPTTRIHSGCRRANSPCRHRIPSRSTTRPVAPPQRRGARGRAFAGLSTAALLLVASLGLAHPVAASGGSLRIEPPVQRVPADATFTAHIVANADVPTSGAGATITFDPSLLQISAVVRGAAYADASVFSGASAAAITAANTSGKLIGVAAAFLPPDAVPAGDAAFLDVTFKAIGCGTASLGLPTGVTDASLLDGRPDTYGAALPVGTVAGSVILCSSLRIEPPVQRVAADATFTAHVVANADVPTSGAGATITFDPALVQISAVARG